MKDVTFRQHTLSSGLQIVAECNPNAYSTGMAYFVKTGARDETPDISGVSHFLEHMVFKGTPTRTAEQVNQQLDQIGSQSNAFTSEEQTVYYCAVLPQYQRQSRFGISQSIAELRYIHLAGPNCCQC